MGLYTLYMKPPLPEFFFYPCSLVFSFMPTVEAVVVNPPEEGGRRPAEEELASPI